MLLNTLYNCRELTRKPKVILLSVGVPSPIQHVTYCVSFFTMNIFLIGDSKMRVPDFFKNRFDGLTIVHPCQNLLIVSFAHQNTSNMCVCVCVLAM